MKQGHLLLRFDKRKSKKEGYSLETPVIVTNYMDLDILENQGETVGPDDATYHRTDLNGWVKEWNRLNYSFSPLLYFQN